MSVWNWLMVNVLLSWMLGNAALMICARLTVFLLVVLRTLLLEPRILVAEPAPRSGWSALIPKQSSLKQTELVFQLYGLLMTRTPSNKHSPMIAAEVCIIIL